MSKGPLVSVIMPVFNVHDTLPHAIESVLAQSLSDLELIVVDDASTDGTADVIRAYADDDPRIKTKRNTRNSRRGPIEWEPRNDGLCLAEGELIAYLDGDNSWDPPMLETLAQVLLTSPDIQLAYCRSRNFHHTSEIDAVIAGDARSAVQRGQDWVVFAQDDLEPDELGRSQYVDTNEMMHRASAFNVLGHQWSTFHPRREWVNQHQGKRCPYRRHNDLDLVERIIAKFGAPSVVQIPQVLVNFYYPSAISRPSCQLPALKVLQAAAS